MQVSKRHEHGTVPAAANENLVFEVDDASSNALQVSPHPAAYTGKGVLSPCRVPYPCIGDLEFGGLARARAYCHIVGLP